MSPTAKRLLAVSALAFAVWTAGAGLAVVFGWPAQVGGPGDPDDMAGELIIRGTAASPPLFLMLVLAVFAALVPRPGRWGTLAAVRLCLLAVLTLAVSLGQALASPTPDVPGAVLVASGAVGGLLSLALLLFGVAELVARARNRPSRAGYGLFTGLLPARRPRSSE
jgi:hypothetical protein